MKEPDGCTGWPKDDSTSTEVVAGLYTDNILGEAMGLRPAVSMAAAIEKDPALKRKYGGKAREYLELSERTFEKWVRRGCWRTARDGGLWVVPPFGIDKRTGKWTDGYARRETDVFSLPANKQNHVARWMIAMYDATKKAVYRERAEMWWRRMIPDAAARRKVYVWDYWDPAGPWDYKPDELRRSTGSASTRTAVITGSTSTASSRRTSTGWSSTARRSTGSSPPIATSCGTTRSKAPVLPSASTAKPDDRWKNSPEVLWLALAPYDAALRWNLQEPRSGGLGRPVRDALVSHRNSAI